MEVCAGQEGGSAEDELRQDALWVLGLMHSVQEPLMAFEVVRWAEFVQGPPLTRERGRCRATTRLTIVFSASAYAALQSLKQNRVLAGIVLLPPNVEEEDRMVYYPGPNFFEAEEGDKEREAQTLERWRKKLQQWDASGPPKRCSVWVLFFSTYYYI